MMGTPTERVPCWILDKLAVGGHDISRHYNKQLAIQPIVNKNTYIMAKEAKVQLVIVNTFVCIWVQKASCMKVRTRSMSTLDGTLSNKIIYD